MAMFYTDSFQSGAGSTFRITRPLLSEQTDFQQVDVLKSELFGRVMLIDGRLTITERDAAFFCEMTVHPVLSVLNGARQVMIAGGGTGGALAEVLKYENVREVKIAELDPRIIQVTREYFPEKGAAFEDQRVSLAESDPARFIEEAGTELDVIIYDPASPAEAERGVEDPEFLRLAAGAVSQKEGGVVFPLGSPFLRLEKLKAVTASMRKLFEFVRVYQAFVPSRATGMFTWAVCTNGLDPAGDLSGEGSPPFETAYYTYDVHRAAFVLPAFARKNL